MKNSSTRRSFLQKLSLGLFSTVLTFSVFRPVKSHHRIPFQEPDESHVLRINPAYKMNVFSDGTVELYTHQQGGEKVGHKFQGFEADILTNISERNDPRNAFQELGLKYSLDKDAYGIKVESTLQSMKDQGFVYQGETMLVKVVEAGDEQ